jgi:hypothetical protein
MRKLIILFITGLTLLLSSCRQDFVFEPSNGELKFSRDTVYLDTVFTNIGSSTYNLKVYNKSNKDIKIPTIKLGKTNSKYRMTVDGMTGIDEDGNGIGDGREFHDVELLAKDSMYVFIEVTADVASANPTDFLYTDQIQFDSGDNFQKVELVTLIQDAYFLYPKIIDDQGHTEMLTIGEDEIYGFFLDENDPINGNEYEWNNTKPYVVYGYGAVPNGKTLNIHPGARVHFHADSGLIVGNGGSLKIDGTYENEVIIEGDRLEPDFSDIPGQWGTIWLTDGSTNNEIKHCTIKNSTVGLLIDNNDGTDVKIENTQIYDASAIGIYAKTAKIRAQNLVINGAGTASLACTLGGDYEFKHCTINNTSSGGRQVAVLIDNYYTDSATNQQVAYSLQKANFYNCIIFGQSTIELSIKKSTDTVVTWNNPLFQKCQIKYNSNTANELYDYFMNDTSQVIKNKNPDFLDPRKNKLMIGNDSDAKDFGNDLSIGNDIINTPRVLPNIDLGAYQHITFPEEN